MARDAGKESMGMKKLFGYAEKYIAGSDWKDFAMLKFCLFAMGVLAGMRIPAKDRKQAGVVAWRAGEGPPARSDENYTFSFRST